MKTPIEHILTNLFENARPALESLSIRIECPFDSGIGVECTGKSSSGVVYPEPDMDALSDYVDELRSSHPDDQFNIVTILMTSPKDIVIKQTFDADFQREAESMVHD
jgi:hypothetical protein